MRRQPGPCRNPSSDLRLVVPFLVLPLAPRTLRLDLVGAAGLPNQRHARSGGLVRSLSAGRHSYPPAQSRPGRRPERSLSSGGPTVVVAPHDARDQNRSPHDPREDLRSLMREGRWFPHGRPDPPTLGRVGASATQGAAGSRAGASPRQVPASRSRDRDSPQVLQAVRWSRRRASSCSPRLGGGRFLMRSAAAANPQVRSDVMTAGAAGATARASSAAEIVR